MGYPMTYDRVVNRGCLHGDYDSPWDALPPSGPQIAGDLRRLEKDQRDDDHIARYAKVSGATPDQVRTILNHFFNGDLPY